MENLRMLIGDGLGHGRTLVVVLRIDDSDHVLGELDRGGLQASAAVSNGRLKIGTAQELGLHGQPGGSGRDPALMAMHAHGPKIGCVISELDPDSIGPFTGGQHRPPACACELPALPQGVTTTCLVILDQVPTSVLLAALDRHLAVVLDGRPVGEWTADSSLADNVMRPRSVLLELYTALLPLIDDPVRLAELEAGMVARLGDAPGAVVSVPGLDLGWVGVENGQSVSPTRQRELAAQLCSPDAVPDDMEILPIPTRERGTVAVIRRPGERLDRRGRTSIESLMAIAACCHDKLADAERVHHLASENSELKVRARAELRNARLIQNASLAIVVGDIRDVLRSMAQDLDCDLALIEPDGTLLAGDAELAHDFKEHSKPRRAVDANAALRPVARPDGRAVLCVPGPRNSSLGYLCISRALDELSDETWGSIGRLLAAALEAHQPARRSTDVSEASLVLALVRADDATRFVHQRWAGRLQVDLACSYRVVVLSPGSGEAVDEARLESWARGVKSIAADMHARSYVAKTPDGLVCLWLDEGVSVEGWAARCQDLLKTLRPGGPGFAAVGSSGVYPKGLADSYEQARRLAKLQCQNAAPLPVPQAVVFEQAGLIADILGPSGGRHLAPFVRRVLGPLLDDKRCGGELIQTLGAYLATRGSPAHTAERLHLHRSSVKYRVKVLRDVIGDRLDDPDRRFELELAIRLLSALRSVGGGMGGVAAPTR